MQILVETQQVQGIPALTVVRAASRAAPVVIWTPGFGASKENGLALGYQLAAAGFFFLAYDPLHHGARADGGLSPHPDTCVYPPETGLDIWLLFCRVIEQCLADMRTLLGELAVDTRADVARVGVTGVSMGGYASTLAFAALTQVQAAVPMVGVPTFTRRWEDLLDECAFSNPDWAHALAQVEARTAESTAWIRSFDPAPLLPDAAPRALFLMNNDFDTDQPKHYAIETVRTLRPAWAASPDRLRLGIYPAAHTVTPDMERDATAWFAAHLLPVA